MLCEYAWVFRLRDPEGEIGENYKLALKRSSIWVLCPCLGIIQFKRTLIAFLTREQLSYLFFHPKTPKVW